jgi:DNA-binding PadR family transcriptional regulator
MDVRTVCLGVLTLGNATGYEIRKMFEDGPFQYFTDAGFGSIYPALNKLHAEGLVTCEQQSQSGRPDKKIYSITREGRDSFAGAIREAPGPDKFRSDFLLGVFFEHFLPQDIVAGAVDERIEWYRAKLEHMRCCDRSGWGTGPVFVNDFGQAVYAAALAFLEENRDELVAAAADSTENQAAE